MISRRELSEAVAWAWQTAKSAGVALRDEEAARIEVADFGLSRLSEVGAQILTLEATAWVSVKLIILRPWQLLPQHRHPPCAAEAYPGKTEILRGQWGELYHYWPGDAAAEPKARPSAADRPHLTVWNERVLRPADQLVVEPNTWHWFQAGGAGAVVWSFSSKVTDAADRWVDPNIVRQTQLAD